MGLSQGMGTMVWSPLGSGLLSGKYRRNQGPPPGSRYADDSNPNYKRRLVEGIYDVLEPLEALAASKDRSGHRQVSSRAALAGN